MKIEKSWLWPGLLESRGFQICLFPPKKREKLVLCPMLFHESSGALLNPISFVVQCPMAGTLFKVDFADLEGPPQA